MKGQFSEADQGFRNASILGKIMDELLQRFCRFFVAFCRLHQAFLQPQIGTRLFVANKFFQVAVIRQKTGVVTELEPASRRVEKRNLRPWRTRTRDLFKIRGSSAKSP